MNESARLREAMRHQGINSWHDPNRDLHPHVKKGLVDIYPQTIRFAQWAAKRDAMRLKGYR